MASQPGQINKDTRELIRKISGANPPWGTPRIIGELGKLGIDVAKSTVDKYRVRPGKPSPTWKAFLKNHVTDLVSIDFFIVPTIRFKLLFVLVVLAHSRRVARRSSQLALVVPSHVAQALLMEQRRNP